MPTRKTSKSNKRPVRKSVHVSSVDALAWYKEIKPYVRFRVNTKKPLTTAQKKKIARYYDEVQSLTIRPHTVFSSRSKVKLEAAQTYSGQDSRLKEMRVAFVPTAQPNSTVEFDEDGDLVIKSRNLQTTVVRFKAASLAKNPGKEIERVLREMPDAKQFQIIAGKYLITQVSFTRETLEQGVIALMNRYPGTVTRHSKHRKQREAKNHGWKNWLFGVHGFRFRNQKSFFDYVKKYRKKSTALKASAAMKRQKTARQAKRAKTSQRKRK